MVKNPLSQIGAELDHSWKKMGGLLFQLWT